MVTIDRIRDRALFDLSVLVDMDDHTERALICDMLAALGCRIEPRGALFVAETLPSMADVTVTSRLSEDQDSVFLVGVDHHIPTLSIEVQVARPVRVCNLEAALQGFGRRSPVDEPDPSFAALLDQDSLAELSTNFARDLRDFLFSTPERDAQTDARLAHSFVTTAVILGFSELAAACQTFETDVLCQRDWSIAQTVLKRQIEVAMLGMGEG